MSSMNNDNFVSSFPIFLSFVPFPLLPNAFNKLLKKSFD